VLRAWAVRVHHRDSPVAASLPARCLPRGRQRSRRPNDAWGTVSPSVLKGSQAGAVLREASSTLDELACGFVDHRDGYPDALWVLIGVDPFMRARTSVPVGSLCRWRARRIFRLRALCSLIPLLSHSAHRSLRRDASREQANPSYGRQEVGERSLYTGALGRLVLSNITTVT